MHDSASAAELKHDRPVQGIPARLMEQALENVVEAVMERGSFPVPRKGKLVCVQISLDGFCDKQEDCAEMLAKCLIDCVDGRYAAQDTIEKRLRAYLDGHDIVTQEAQRLMEEERDDAQE